MVEPGLGTLNNTVLTMEALRIRDLPVLGVVVGSWPLVPDLASRCNLKDLPDIASAPLLGVLPEGAARDETEWCRAALRGLAPTLAGRWDATTFVASRQQPFPS